MRKRIQTALIGALAIAATACATNDRPAAPEENWTAHVYLSPGAEPEILGTYAGRDDCEEAVSDWMSRQVVGNPVSGECLPIDRR